MFLQYLNLNISVYFSTVGFLGVGTIARWKLAIKNSLNGNPLKQLPVDSELPLHNDDICIVEVKKLNEEKHKSTWADLEKFSTKDRDLLKEQLDVIDPEIIVCCGTFGCYDIIYDYEYEIEKQLKIVSKCSCWRVNNRLAIDFYHPSTYPSYWDPNNNDIEYFKILNDLMSDAGVINEFKLIKGTLK